MSRISGQWSRSRVAIGCKGIVAAGRCWPALLIWTLAAISCPFTARTAQLPSTEHAVGSMQSGVDHPVNFVVHEGTAKEERAEQTRLPIAPEGPMPLAVAGPWEGLDPIQGKGTLIGIFIKIDAVWVVRLNHQGAVVGNVSAKSRLPEGFFFYQRTAGIEKRVWFKTGLVLPGVSSSFNGHRLQAKFKNAKAPPTSFARTGIALDLTFNQVQQVWTGDYTRGDVTKRIRLERPGAGSGNRSSPFVGTWSLYRSKAGEPPAVDCLSIVQGADGVFLAWEDGMGLQKIGTGRPPATATLEDYAGQRWGINVKGDTITLDRTAYMAGVAGGIGPSIFVGKLSANGKQIVGRSIWSLKKPPPATLRNKGPIVILSRTSRPCVSSLSIVLPAKQPCQQ